MIFLIVGSKNNCMPYIYYLIFFWYLSYIFQVIIALNEYLITLSIRFDFGKHMGCQMRNIVFKKKELMYLIYGPYVALK